MATAHFTRLLALYNVSRRMAAGIVARIAAYLWSVFLIAKRSNGTALGLELRSLPQRHNRWMSVSPDVLAGAPSTSTTALTSAVWASSASWVPGGMLPALQSMPSMPGTFGAAILLSQ